MATPFAFETLVIDNTAGGVACTSATYNPGGRGAAQRAFIGPLETGQIRYRYDGGAPTATVGHLLELGETLVLSSPQDIINFRGIRTGTTSGSLPVTYEE